MVAFDLAGAESVSRSVWVVAIDAQLIQEGSEVCEKRL
jgi:hypothetical protein